MSESSEEKNLPPTPHKLKKAREKGQVVTSKDTLASVATIVGLGYLYMRRASITENLKQLFSYDPDPALSFAEQLADKAKVSLDLGLMIVVPLLVGVIVIGILGGMTISGGPVFSTHPLIPDFKKLNPAEGFKKIFGKRALLGFLMHVVRLSAVTVVLGILAWGYFGAMISTPPCGMDCASYVMDRMMGPLLMATIAILTLAALFDYLVQRSSFMREQRMSITELKREFKDQDGDPLLKGQMRSDQRAMVDRPTGLSQATTVIHNAPHQAVGIRYVEGDTPAPLVVIRARGSQAVRRLLRQAKVDTHFDAETVAKVESIAVGDYITRDDQITAIAPYLR